MTGVVVYVTREHPITGADQLLVLDAGSDHVVPAGEIAPGEAIEDAARRTVYESAGIDARLARDLGSARGSRFVQAVTVDSTNDEWEHEGARCRWVPVRAGLRRDQRAFLAELRRQRVVAYVTRERDGATELLTIEHRDMPEAGVQVPAGRVDLGETLEHGVRREVAEETGLENVRAARKLPDFEAEYETPHQSRAFHLVGEDEGPDSWEHEAYGDGSDAGLVYICRWVPLTLDLRLWNARDPMLRHLPYSQV